MSAARTVVLLASVDWDAVRGTDRHLAEALQESVRVIWVDPALSVARVVRRRQYGRLLSHLQVEQVGTRIERVSALSPPYPARRGFDAVARGTMRRGLAKWVRRRGIEVSGVMGTSPFSSLQLIPASPYAQRLYYATDDFIAGASLMGVARATIALGEAARLREADRVAAVSDTILQRWGVQGSQGVVIPNGCASKAYAGVEDAPLPTDVSLQSPVAGVVGQLSTRINLDLLEAVAQTGHSLLLVGPMQASFEPDRMARLLTRSNVQHVGPKKFEELPSYLRVIDVGLTPYELSDFNRASFPLKTLEYIAAGRPVASTALPAVEALGSPWVHIATHPMEYASLVASLGRERRTEELMDQRRAFAEAHSWARRAETVLVQLGLG